ncbi:TNT domain-containing protein [Saccharothrix coeruleofusca]|uniref:DUF4237 domain-containing protein n=1 Tax=Saccharothrix coeruleofusca TaxID=33919 RepID=A0A918EG34_9PSEU|nr:TNT domain-containing protein [Saccharothrix coeruleofusca]GGP70283.1 hypothetical protein GCM10010185_49140 [Saccharothrix coeruleofusca]
MGIELPAELAEVAARAGVVWPKADEDAMRASAAAWREAGTKLAALASESDGAAGAALRGATGATADAARRHWNAFVAPDGHLSEVVRGCRAAADRLDHAAERIGAAKVELVRELVDLAKNTDAANTAAKAGHPTALLGLDTAVRGASVNAAHLTQRLAEAVRLDGEVGAGHGQTPVSADPGARGGLLGGLLGEVVAPVAGAVTAPVAGVVAPVVGEVVAPLVGDVVAPVVGGVVTPLVGDVVAPLVGDVVAPVVGEVVAPVVNEVVAPVVDDVIAPVVGEVVTPLVGDVVAPVVGEVVAPVVDEVVAPVAGEVVAPIVGGVAAPAVTAPVTDAVAGAVAPAVNPIAAPLVGDVAATGAVQPDVPARGADTVSQSAATLLERPVLPTEAAPPPAQPAQAPAASGQGGSSFGGPAFGGQGAAPASGGTTGAGAPPASAPAQAAQAAQAQQAPGQRAEPRGGQPLPKDPRAGQSIGAALSGEPKPTQAGADPKAVADAKTGHDAKTGPDTKTGHDAKPDRDLKPDREPVPSAAEDSAVAVLPGAGGLGAVVPTELVTATATPSATAPAEPRDEPTALLLLSMFPGGTLPAPRRAPARQLPTPSDDRDFAAGLRFEPGGHPDGHLVDATARPLPRRAPGPGRDDIAHLVEGYDPQAGMHERDWDHRFLVRADPPEYAWPPGELFPEGGYEQGQPGVLAPGTEVDRFGTPEGRVLSEAGTPFAARALPPALLTAGYRRYRVVRELPVWFTLSAPWFGQDGGGVRYRTTHPVVELVALGHLEELS